MLMGRILLLMGVLVVFESCLRTGCLGRVSEGIEIDVLMKVIGKMLWSSKQ